MDFKNVLEGNGVSVSSDMDPKKVVGLLTSSPTLLSMVPVIGTAVNTLKTFIDNVTRAKSVLRTAENGLTTAQNAMQKAMRAQTVAASKVQPIAPSGGGPCAPDLATTAAVETAFEVAQTGIDNAEAVVTNARNSLDTAERAVYSQVERIVDLITNTKVQ